MIRGYEGRSVNDARKIVFAKPLVTALYTPYDVYTIYNIFYYYYICYLPYIIDVAKAAMTRINIGPE